MPFCSKCNAPIVWMGTTGKNRMPIDAILKRLYIPHGTLEAGKGTSINSSQVFKEVEGYTSHLATCPKIKKNNKIVRGEKP